MIAHAHRNQRQDREEDVGLIFDDRSLPGLFIGKLGFVKDDNREVDIGIVIQLIGMRVMGVVLFWRGGRGLLCECRCR